MTKVLVREVGEHEELDQLDKFLRTERQQVVKLTEEEPATEMLAEDDLTEITWFLHYGGPLPTSLYTVVISPDGTGAEGANKLVMKEDFSPTMLLDDVRREFETPAPKPLLQLEEGYLIGDAEKLTFVRGVATTSPEDPERALELWRQRLAVQDPQNEIPSGSETEEEPEGQSDIDKPAIAVIETGRGW